MKNFINFWNTNHPDDLVPEKEISGAWFASRRLPMVVRCSCCQMTMALPSAFIDEDERTYCSDCSCED